MEIDREQRVRKQWKVDVSIDERDGHTRAIAKLHWGDRVAVGTGLAKCHPLDRDVADIGDELAVSRALSDLSLRIQTVARRHIESTTGELVTRH